MQQPVLPVTAQKALTSTLVRVIQKAHPTDTLTNFIYPGSEEKPILAYAKEESSETAAYFMNPATGEILGKVAPNPVLKFLQEAHYNLLLNTTGRKINAFGGLILLFLSLSGVVLICRGVNYCIHTLKMKWKGSARVISWSKHQKLGVVMLPMLLIWGMSAFSFGFHAEFESIVNVIMPLTSSGSHTSSKAALPAINNLSPNSLEVLDAAVKIAAEQCPGQRLSRITFPGKKKKSDDLKIWMTDSATNNKVNATEIDFNLKTGQTTAIIRPEFRTAGDTFLVWLPRIHFGNFAGLPSKLVWIVVGFTPLLLSITGLIMWWNPGRKSRKTAAP